MAANCKLCKETNKNPKQIIPASKWHPLKSCFEPNEEIRIDFGGKTTSENDQDNHFLACIDCFPKYPTVEVLYKANRPNVVKFLSNYVQIHGVPINT